MELGEIPASNQAKSVLFLASPCRTYALKPQLLVGTSDSIAKLSIFGALGFHKFCLQAAV